MNTIRQSLDVITTGYSIFEKDQVLTELQLNTVADYFDDQTRLTRTKLLGVGIVCGLRVSLVGSNISVSKGAGITTDGDLLFFSADTLFDRFRPYDGVTASYGPFDSAVKKNAIYELLPKSSTDTGSDIISLSQFAAKAGPFDTMVAVLFMEGYVKDEDICNGGDCDNLGQTFVSTIKLVLVDERFVGPLIKSVASADDAARSLSEVTADRVLLSPAINSGAAFAAAYRKACKAMIVSLAKEFKNFFSTCGAFLAPAFVADPAQAWIARLDKLNTTIGDQDQGIQYFYDFLKDIVETYNRFRELLFGDATWCSPEVDGFPKHLLLGDVVGADPAANRTPFYPSPLASPTTEQLDHARFLAQKLDALIQTFTPPGSVNAIRVTPSCFEDAPLEERAIPYYYKPGDATNPIEQRWNFRLHRQNMDAWNYSYNAGLYNAQGGAAAPFSSQIGRFPFFRIEGHLGQTVSSAVARIENEIKANNLPFVVQSVFLGVEKTKVTVKPGILYTDLHSLHQILRTDLTYQLDDVKTFSGHYVDLAKQQSGLVSDASLKSATNRDSDINDKVTGAQAVLNRSYPLYKANAGAWKPAVKDTISASAEMKQQLGDVTKTEFTTPFDSLIGLTHPHWIDWLDIILQDKDDKKTEKFLFPNFQTLHPGLEHFAGVVRGGTFVLLYDDDNHVVGDLMLPYHCCEPAPEPDPKEPPLPKPPIKLPNVILDGVTLRPPIEKQLELGLQKYTEQVVDPKINIQKEFVKSYTDSMSSMVNVFSRPAGGKTVVPESTFQDSLLDAAVGDTRSKRDALDMLKARAADPTLPADQREKLAGLIKPAEADLAKSIQGVTNYVSEAGVDVSAGSEGFNAMMELSEHATKITDSTVKSNLKTNLGQIQGRTNNPRLKNVIGAINM